MSDALGSAPRGVQDVVARNVVKSDKWLVIGMDSVPPVVVANGNFNHADWLEVLAAVRHKAENQL